MNAQETAGKITVRTRNWRDQGVLMVVHDNGRGISAEALPRIFDPFYTQTKSGTGLGLYVSSGIHGQGDLSASEYDWNNHVARVSITRMD